MVGVPKSTGCAMCRKRKIKCDESWPTCLNCQKNRKCCPGPPARHTFKDLGPKLYGPPVDDLETSSSSNCDSPVLSDVGSAFRNTANLRRKLTVVKEKWSDNGSVYHKWRICTGGEDLPSREYQSRGQSRRSLILQQPSLSNLEILTRALIEGMSTGGKGYKLSQFGPFMNEVPRRLGQNAALDAAVACLVSAQASMVRRKSPDEIADPRLYIIAVQNLQLSLEDPVEGMSSNTLCATVLLSMVELMAGPRQGNRYLTHVGGARRLIQLQGPQSFRDPFGKEILRFTRGSAIVWSLYQRRRCFLTDPEWFDTAFDTTDLSADDTLYTEVLIHMATFPEILGDFKAVESAVFSSDPDAMFTHVSSRADVLARLLQLKNDLYALEIELKARLTDGRAAIEVPSLLEDTPIPTSFHFSCYRISVIYGVFWSLLIMVNKLLLNLMPSPLLDEYAALEQECRAASYEICKMWEDSWASRPIGAFHTGLSSLMAYEWCAEHVQDWIIECQNKLLGAQTTNTWRWSRANFPDVARKLLGEGEPGFRALK